MAEALAAVGLASSIITFIDFSVEFRKLVRSISQSHGSLPKELEECHEYIGVVAVLCRMRMCRGNLYTGLGGPWQHQEGKKDNVEA
jgi:hypothetical protein